MKSLKTLLLAGTCFLAASPAVKAQTFNNDWVNKVRLPLFMVNSIFGLLSLDPSGEDTSAALYKQLVAFDTVQTFVAIQGFGYAFQDEIS